MTDQQRYEDDARAWLAGVVAPPPRLEVEQLVVAAQRSTRRRRRLVVAGTGLAVLAALVAVPAAGQLVPPRDGDPPPAATPHATATPVACGVTDLELPAELIEAGAVDPAAVRVTAMDPTGRYVVGTASGAGVLWDGGNPTAIPAPWADDPLTGAATHVVPVAVNARGEVVGEGMRGPRQRYTWIHQAGPDGEQSVLPIPEGYERSWPAGINQAGDVVGTVEDAAGVREVVVWPANSRDQPRLLAPPPDAEGEPVAILDDGTVVGSVSGATGGYVWDQDGVGRELPLPAGAVAGVVEAAGGHWAVALAYFPLSEAAVEEQLREAEREGLSDGELSERRRSLLERAVPMPVRWDLRDGTSTVLPGFHAEAFTRRLWVGDPGMAVNPRGDVVIDNVPGSTGAVVLRADGREAVLPVPAEEQFGSPVAITDDGSRLAGNLVADREVEEERAGGSGLPAPESANPQRPSEEPDPSRPVVWDC